MKKTPSDSEPSTCKKRSAAKPAARTPSIPAARASTSAATKSAVRASTKAAPVSPPAARASTSPAQNSASTRASTKAAPASAPAARASTSPAQNPAALATNSTTAPATPIEKQLWKSADLLRKNIDAAEYKHIVLGLIFLRYISNAFSELYEKLKQGEGEFEGANPEDRNEYTAENVFFVPAEARWQGIRSKARQPDIGKQVDSAMDAIEKENPSLKGVLPTVYARGNIDPANLGGLIDLISNISMNQAEERSADILGHVFEYFLGEFALAEGKNGGQFYTPKSVVTLLVEMLEPYKGRVLDPCCGSGGMFVQSEEFVKSHRGNVRNISIFGQESNQTTWRLSKMNLAIRKINSANIRWNNEGSFLHDAHPDISVDFVIANPPFNDSDWSGDLLCSDARWAYGTPPEGNANYAWIQHFLHHLNPQGQAGFVLAKGSLTTNSSQEGEIRKNIVEAKLVDCIVNLPAKLFLNTQIPACLWFLNRASARKNEILFIDARHKGQLINRKNRIFSDSDIRSIAETFHNWRSGSPSYADVNGYCHSTPIERVRELNYVLSPGRYVGLPHNEDHFNFPERFTQLQSEFHSQLKEEETLNKRIIENLKRVEL